MGRDSWGGGGVATRFDVGGGCPVVDPHSAWPALKAPTHTDTHQPPPLTHTHTRTPHTTHHTHTHKHEHTHTYTYTHTHVHVHADCLLLALYADPVCKTSNVNALIAGVSKTMGWTDVPGAGVTKLWVSTLQISQATIAMYGPGEGVTPGGLVGMYAPGEGVIGG